jgi:hypothetical protein
MIFLTKCSWHRQYFGQTLWTKVERLEGSGYQVSDGICGACRDRLLGEMRKG